MSTSDVDLVINTGPIIALAAGVEQPELVLRHLRKIIIPREVADEVLAGMPGSPGRTILTLGEHVEVVQTPTQIRSDLRTLLDRGERLDLATIISNMRRSGIWIGDAVAQEAISLSLKRD